MSAGQWQVMDAPLPFVKIQKLFEAVKAQG
jgi:hypothetical protein